MNASVPDSEVAPVSESHGMPHLFHELSFLAENIKPYTCYEIRVHALSGDRARCSSTRGNSKHKGESCDLWPDFALV